MPNVPGAVISWTLRLAATAATLLVPPAAHAQVPPPGLIHHWAFDEGAGALAADAVGGAPGSVTAAWTAGKLGQALAFNGSAGGYVSLGTFSDVRGTRSVAMWLRPGSLTGTRHLFVAGASADADHLQVSLVGGRPLASARARYGSGQKRSSRLLSSDTWHHLVIVKSAGVIERVYVDGADVTTAASDYSGTGGSAAIGGYARAGSFVGLIDDVRVYDRALSAAEVQALHGGDGGTPARPVLTAMVSGPGSIVSSPAGIQCGSTCSQAFDAGTLVTLTAQPAAGAVFNGWSLCAGTGSCQVTMDAARSITATFTGATGPTATLEANPARIAPGQSSVLSWSSTNATSCTAGGGWSGRGGPSGSATVRPSSTTTYTATCSGGSGSATASATVTVEAPAEAGLCTGLVQDTLARPMPALAKPAKGQAVTDPVFGTRIVRVTDVQADFASKIAKPAYSTMPAWNLDERYLLLYVTSGPGTGHHLFDGRSYQYLRKLDIKPTDIEHVAWSAKDPEVLYFTHAWEQSGTSLRQLVKYTVNTNHKEVVYDIPDAASPDAYKVDMGGDPIFSSWDSDLFGLRRRGLDAARTDTGFTFRLSTRTEGPRRVGGAPQIAPSGTVYLFGQDVVDAATHTRLRGMKSDTREHGDITRLANGQDVWVSTQFDVAPYGTLIAENLQTGVVTELIGQKTGYPYPPSGTHLSGHAFRQPGWVAVSVTGNRLGQNLLDQELLLADLNNGRVCRVAHHRSTGGSGPHGYWAEPHVNISPSGTRLLFGSDWSGGASVDAYVVELPSHR